MLCSKNWRECLGRPATYAGLCAFFAGASVVAMLAGSDQPSEDHVGVIDGENIAINGPMSVESVGGQIKTVLRSGSEVRVKSGRARISLVEGGQISICGPAHLSLLKSGGSLTIALDSGVIHVLADQQPALTIYTPEIEGKSIAIGDEPREVLVGFEGAGLMCIRTYRGALRLEQQLSGQSLMVPQGGDVTLANGRFETLRNEEGHCKCELQVAKVTAPAVPASPPASPAAATGTNDSSETMPGRRVQSARSSDGTAPPPEKPAPKDDVIYHIDMPPLQYDANARVQPAADPQFMMIVKRVRVRPTLIFQGRVEAPPVQTAATASPPKSEAAAVPPAVQKPAPAPEPSMSDRVRAFFHRLWSR